MKTAEERLEEMAGQLKELEKGYGLPAHLALKYFKFFLQAQMETNRALLHIGKMLERIGDRT